MSNKIIESFDQLKNYINQEVQIRGQVNAIYKASSLSAIVHLLDSNNNEVEIYIEPIYEFNKFSKKNAIVIKCKIVERYLFIPGLPKFIIKYISM